MRSWPMLPVLLAICASSLPAQAQWADDPSDSPRSHVEETSSARHAYTVTQRGTMDGANCRSPLSVGMSDGPAIERSWESNRSVRLENIGETNVKNPWISNGRNLFRNLDEIVASAVKPGMTDREKAHAIWFQEIRHRYHFSGDNDELGDPVKVLNIYGYNTCGNDSICLAGLWKKAGLKVSPARVVGHCVTQCYFDDRWNLFDGDMHAMYLLRDSTTIASERDLARDHDLIRRTHTQGILNPDRRAADEWEASIYTFTGPPTGDRNSVQDTSMNMTLRPGEAITWRWGHAEPVKYHGEKPRYPDTICNGQWQYRPDFTHDLWRQGATSIENVSTRDGALVAAAGKVGSVVWNIRVPYVLVGGMLSAEGSGAKFTMSWDGKSWHEIRADLDPLFPPAGPARYGYLLRCELEGDARLTRLEVTNDLQMAPFALPEMTIGANRFVYTDESQGPRRVRIAHLWVERSGAQPPEPPKAPTYPRDDAEVEGTNIVFRWPAPDAVLSTRESHAPAAHDDIVDFHFELSERPDMAWPLSPNFDKLISRTADRGRAQYTLPQAGLPAVDHTYYWRVRAKNAAGVWGPWSPTWRFTPRGPACPVDVAVAFDREKNAANLRWKPNPLGRRPVKYRIYGSDEKGFQAGDEPYESIVGISQSVPLRRPGNFITETSATEAAVIGPDITLPNANRAYYRVVAIDHKGNRSGPSDFAEAPRPIVYSDPVTTARVGSPYRCAVAVIRSLGDLRTRVESGGETMNYWDIESPRFVIRRAPGWLKIDDRTGILSGVPDRDGKAEVELAVSIDREVRRRDLGALAWGLEKMLSVGIERVGETTQTFTIDVAPR